jgi:hypothetical protein
LYGRHSENPSLQDAVLAAAYANIAQRTARRDLELKAASLYHASLETVKNNLSSPQLATSDINMTAVILLGLYEVSLPTTATSEAKSSRFNHPSASIILPSLTFLTNISKD